VGEFRIFSSHIFSMTLPEMVALGSSSVSMAMGATIAAEALCDQPGLGQLAWKAALARDLPLLLALTLLIAAVTLVCNRAADTFLGLRRVSA
jgi:peptide/nickel transport system permease protein